MNIRVCSFQYIHATRFVVTKKAYHSETISTLDLNHIIRHSESNVTVRNNGEAIIDFCIAVQMIQ